MMITINISTPLPADQSNLNPGAGPDPEVTLTLTLILTLIFTFITLAHTPTPTIILNLTLTITLILTLTLPLSGNLGRSVGRDRDSGGRTGGITVPPYTLYTQSQPRKNLLDLSGLNTNLKPLSQTQFQPQPQYQPQPRPLSHPIPTPFPGKMSKTNQNPPTLNPLRLKSNPKSNPNSHPKPNFNTLFTQNAQNLTLTPNSQNYAQNYSQNNVQNYGQNYGQNNGQNYGQNYGHYDQITGQNSVDSPHSVQSQSQSLSRSLSYTSIPTSSRSKKNPGTGLDGLITLIEPPRYLTLTQTQP
jgi:hypothetical protein